MLKSLFDNSSEFLEFEFGIPKAKPEKDEKLFFEFEFESNFAKVDNSIISSERKQLLTVEYKQRHLNAKRR